MPTPSGMKFFVMRALICGVPTKASITPPIFPTAAAAGSSPSGAKNSWIDSLADWLVQPTQAMHSIEQDTCFPPRRRKNSLRRNRPRTIPHRRRQNWRRNHTVSQCHPRPVASRLHAVIAVRSLGKTSLSPGVSLSQKRIFTVKPGC